MSPTRQEREALRSALIDVEVETRLLAHQVATRLGVSRRTLGRYVHKQSFPTPSAAVALLQRLTFVSAPRHARVASALLVPEHQRPPLPSTAMGTEELRARAYAAESAMALMLYATAEASGVSPAAARKVAGAVLEHVATQHLDVATARGVLTGSLRSWPTPEPAR
jgi:transcriptional regulator with XRE-family HTH domain